jgi:hypothetical protein
MVSARGVVVLCMGLASLMACGEGRQPSAVSDSDLAQAFRDGAWVLTVDRTLRNGVSASGFPATPLSEVDFAPVLGGPVYRLAVSQHAAQIEIAEPRMVGQLEQAIAERLTYRLVEGTPSAGGRMVLWREQGGLQAELTIYGSGVPVVKSERGPIRQAQ